MVNVDIVVNQTIVFVNTSKTKLQLLDKGFCPFMNYTMNCKLPVEETAKQKRTLL